MRIIILDDDKAFANEEKRVIEQHLAIKDAIAEVRAFTKTREFLKELEEHSYDIIFLDIDLDEGNGFQVAKIIREKHKECAIVFVSNLEETVYNCFAYQPLKFIRKRNFHKEILSVFNYMDNNPDINDRYLSMNTPDGLIKCAIADIYFIESQTHYSIVHCKDKSVTFRINIGTLAEVLEKFKFIRCHLCYIVNFKYISKLHKMQFILDDGTDIPISKRKRPEVKQIFEKYMRDSLL